jgi:pimeloyl-ACP methyl ester carboxylesterase
MTGTRIDVQGVPTYYDVLGSGRKPLVLLHGGFQVIDTMSQVAEMLSQEFKVYLPERRGHGRTPDVEGPITYALMAADTLTFMDGVGVDRPDVVGYSDGGILGLLLAIRAPDRVGRLVCISANTSPEVIDFATFMSEPRYRATIQAMRDDYDALSPDGAEHRPVVREKLMRMWAEEPRISADELASIRCPTLVMAGDRDLVPVDHTVQLWQSIPNASMIPGSSHLLLSEKPAVVRSALLDFLGG